MLIYITSKTILGCFRDKCSCIAPHTQKSEMICENLAASICK